MHKLTGLVTVVLGCWFSSALAQSRADLSGIAFILDPGHSRNENVGMYGYSEAYKVLDVAFHLKEFLQRSRPDTVVMTRTDRETLVTITQRITFANNFPHPNKWFQSIHSDAATMGSEVNSILILISDRCAAATGQICDSRWGMTTISAGNWQSDLLARTYRIPTRGVWGDRTFGHRFGTSYGARGVGVLRETTMPATLSEGGFHTNPRQNLLNMNMESKRSEAKAIWLAFLGHFEVPRPPVRTLMGIISDLETNAPINGAVASIAGRTYRTNTYEDTFRPYVGTDTTLGNGFYYFENLPGGSQTLSISKPGYYDTTLQVTVIDSFFTFQDVRILSNLPPRLVSSIPAHNATGVLPNASITLTFSRPIERTSAVNHIYLLDPSGRRVAGTFSWSNLDRTVSFRPAALLLLDTTYRCIIGGQVRGVYHHLFDGNGDGIGGDSLVISFRTRAADVTAPAIVSHFPAANTVLPTSNHVINVTFDEALDTTTVILGNFRVVEGYVLADRSLRYWQAGDRSGVNIYLTKGLSPGQRYRVEVRNVADRNGNLMPSPLVWDFTVAPATYEYTLIDDFNTTIANWWQPGASGSTVGIERATFARDTIVTLPTLPSNTGSARLNFSWNTAAPDWLIRVFLSGGAPRSVLWRKEATRLQVYVHGDGSGTQFRFCVDDSVDAFPGGRAENHEVSEWKTIDWVGWRLVEWDLENDPVGSWIGNGKLEGLLRFDSFQLKYVSGRSAASGQIYFDQLQLAKKSPTLVTRDPELTPATFTLHQNYPNPFNPETRITYDVGKQAFVVLEVLNLLGGRIRTLVSADHQPGRYTVTWDGRDDGGKSVAAGVYFYRLRSQDVYLTRKMLYLK